MPHYSLDYTLKSDYERLALVERILASTYDEFSPRDCERFANYILDGSNGTATANETALPKERRYAAGSRETSLDTIMEKDYAREHILQPLDRTTLQTKRKFAIARTPEVAASTPGIAALWESIDALARILYISTHPNTLLREGEHPLQNSYHIYKLRHWVQDLRRHQYYLYEAYHPPIRFNFYVPSSWSETDFTQDAALWVTEEELRERIRKARLRTTPTNLESYEKRTLPSGTVLYRWIVNRQVIDFKDPWHVRQFIKHYSAIYQQNWDRLDSYGRALVYDFDRITTFARLPDLYYYILTRRIDGAKVEAITEEIQEKLGRTVGPSYVQSAISRLIPQRVAEAETLLEWIVEAPPSSFKRCYECGRYLPAKYFFANNIGRTDGYESVCKKCGAERRQTKGDNDLVVKVLRWEGEEVEHNGDI